VFQVDCPAQKGRWEGVDTKLRMWGGGDGQGGWQELPRDHHRTPPRRLNHPITLYSFDGIVHCTKVEGEKQKRNCGQK
jgi:hypothetical protein